MVQAEKDGVSGRCTGRRYSMVGGRPKAYRKRRKIGTSLSLEIDQRALEGKGDRCTKTGEERVVDMSAAERIVGYSLLRGWCRG